MEVNLSLSNQTEQFITQLKFLNLDMFELFHDMLDYDLYINNYEEIEDEDYYLSVVFTCETEPILSINSDDYHMFFYFSMDDTKRVVEETFTKFNEKYN